MDYKIIHADPAIGQIQVMYSKDGQDVGVFAIDVPIIDGAYLVGDALDVEIKSRAPVWVATRKAETQVASNFDQIEALVQPPEVLHVTAEELNRRDMLEQMAFEKRLGPTLVKWGLLSQDPAVIEVTSL